LHVLYNYSIYFRFPVITPDNVSPAVFARQLSIFYHITTPWVLQCYIMLMNTRNITRPVEVLLHVSSKLAPILPADS